MKTVKTRAFLDRLKGHNDEVIEMSSPGGETGG
jgi:hypothetical protein